MVMPAATASSRAACEGRPEFVTPSPETSTTFRMPYQGAAPSTWREKSMAPETEQSKSGRERAIALARREGLTVRQLAQRLGGYAGAAMVGTPATIADEMQEWLETGACDGFNIMFPHVPEGLEDFVTGVVPELQRRGLFRTEYTGTTLREHLGLPRPANRFFTP